MRTNRGFTLVELLVVIAIIGILAGLLLPSLMKSQSAARETACMNNLSQFGKAIEMYKGSWGSQFPYWLSSAYKDEMGKQAGSYRCPADWSKGNEGSKPDWMTGDSQYAETNDMNPDATSPQEFTTYDLIAPNTSSGKTSGWNSYNLTWGGRPTEGYRNLDVKACSYLYEFCGAYCTWYPTDGYDLDGDNDKTEAATYTWQEVKQWVVKSTITVKVNGVDTPSNVGMKEPVVRCFYHVTKEGTTPNESEKSVLNLRYSNAVNKSKPTWEGTD